MGTAPRSSEKQTSAIDYAYTRNFLHRLNSLRVDGRPLYEHFIDERGYDWWQAYQQSLFSEIKIYSSHRFSAQAASPKITSRLRHVGRVAWVAVAGGVAICMSLVTACVIKRKHGGVFIYSVDLINSAYRSDQRIASLYAALQKKKVAYVECFHTMFKKNFFRHLRLRRRWSVYWEALSLLAHIAPWVERKNTVSLSYSAIDWSGFSEDERLFAVRLVQGCVRRFAYTNRRVRIAMFFLTQLSVTKAFFIDDTRYYHELIVACRERGIPSYALQHGHLTKYHVGWLAYAEGSSARAIMPDTYIVWSEYWKKELLRLGTYFDAARIVVGGYPTVSNREIYHDYADGQQKKYGILIPFESDAPKSSVARFVDTILQDEDMVVYFKLRSDVPAKQQVEEYGFTEHYHPRFIVVTDVLSILPQIHIVVGTYSTFLYDMVRYRKPVAILKTSLDYGEGMVVNGLASMLDMTNGNMSEQIRDSVSLSPKTVEQRYYALYGGGTVSLECMIESLLV